MEHNASIIGEYTGILLLNQCCQKGIFNFEWLWHTARWYITKLQRSIPYAPLKLQIELLELTVIIKCTMYTNVFIKIIFVVELWHNWNNYGHNIEHNGWLFWALLKSIIGKNLSIIGQGLLSDTYFINTLYQPILCHYLLSANFNKLFAHIFHLRS